MHPLSGMSTHEDVDASDANYMFQRLQNLLHEFGPELPRWIEEIAPGMLDELRDPNNSGLVQQAIHELETLPEPEYSPIQRINVLREDQEHFQETSEPLAVRLYVTVVAENAPNIVREVEVTFPGDTTAEEADEILGLIQDQVGAEILEGKHFNPAFSRFSNQNQGFADAAYNQEVISTNTV
eukprot:gb/GECG01010973.1/.p1 GENE.gb/GECG01010973.1/~~gb/GECG01010973.1/.p1  ORF type:complete len:182 (+),score=21.25 gb/GECG01010973.1/:1-546(+)